MKRRLFTITAMITLASIMLVGCGKKQDTAETENVAGISETVVEQVEISEEEPETEPEEIEGETMEQADVESEEADEEATDESGSEAEDGPGSEGEEEPATKETEYGEGSYLIEVRTDDGYLAFEFQDGELLHHEWDGSFDTWGGKDSYGYYRGIEESPYYGKTVEEITKMLEDSGYDYSLTKE